MWQLPFNFSKCTALHLGKFNPRYVYNMNGHSIEEVSKEKDLARSDNWWAVKVSWSYIVYVTNRTIGIIKKTFVNMNTDTFLTLYRALICLQLEYANVIWGPFKIKTKFKMYKSSYKIDSIYKTSLLQTKTLYSGFTISWTQTFTGRHDQCF